MNAILAPAKLPPIVNFDRSQREFFEDEARVIVANFHRQKGKDFVAAAKAVEHAARTGQDWFIVSLTQRQADATFAKARKFAEAYKRVAKLQSLEFSEEQYVEWDRSIDQQFNCTSRKITFPSGGSVISLPGRDPDTLAGLTGNIILTEFGLFPNGGYNHWSVIFPISTRGFQVIVISTPRGKNTKFYELCNDPQTYSVHVCDIYQSVGREGFVLRDNRGNACTIDQFRRLYNDESKWPREYECKFTGDLESLIKWAMLEEAAYLGEEREFNLLRISGENGFDPNFFTSPPFGVRAEVGWDVARRGHLSVVTVNFSRFGQPKHLRFMALMQGTPFALQRMVLTAAMECTPYRSVGCGDSTGLGMESNEWLESKYKNRWEPVNFGGSRKKELASALATGFGDKTQTIPTLHGPYKFVATDVYAIQKCESGESLTLEETDNPLLPESHCDIGWSLALARMAGAKNFVEPLPAPTEKPVGF